MRLIDANALKERILTERDKIPLLVPAAPYELVKRKPNTHGNAMRGGIRVALRCMEQTPAIDAVPVVRCKDCDMAVESGKGYLICVGWGCPTDFEGFCYKGERRENNEQNPIGDRP